MKRWMVSMYFPRKGERDYLPEVYKNFTEADRAAFNINRWTPKLEAKAEEVESMQECRQKRG